MPRSDGFYWVNFENWGFQEGGRWYIIGNEDSFQDTDFEKIFEIPIPEEH